MWNVLLLIVGFLCLIKGADWFVDGASKLAERFGIPQLVIGLTIVAMGTSLPEAAVSIQGAIKGAAGIVLWLGVVRKQQLRRPCGIIMLIGYGVYLGYLLVK